ncbi:peptidoglycan-binding domain-containing protein [Pseudophaeobacter flagellatus]|uniref:peptidoglycan-binding domain-containing protein n=1 Tax=Pseudophaeobacter flagellatus TaxID=2899119 RepID=UPI001E5D1EE0|nr:peptidoglycan-binding protein [Pseudophaeobacter flagellatus]MCD9148109.1 peptidoglycan-binding protein [Pseudophaeobacter flagellatus]
MAILKKGTTGKDVKEVQKLLNRGGAKLKEDGIFGPLTEAATRKFQKKVKLKSDGQVGALTLAALKYGKPLPEMNTMDYAKFMTKMRVDWDDNADILSIVRTATKALSETSANATKEIAAAFDFINANYASMKDVVKMGDEVIAKQKEFEVLLLKNPAAAEKLSKDCAALDTKIKAIGKKTVSPNRAKAADALKRADKAMDMAVAAVKECRKSIKAERATW